MHPHADAGRLKRRHALRQEARDNSGKHVAGAGGGEPGRRVGGDAGASVRRRHHRIRPLQQHHRATTLGGVAHPLQFRAVRVLVAAVAEQPRKLAFMRGEHDLQIVGGLDRFKQSIRRLGKTRERVSIEHQVPLQ